MIKLSFKKILLITFLFIACNSYAKSALWVSYNLGGLTIDRVDNIASVIDSNISSKGEIEIICLQEVKSNEALNQLHKKSNALSKLKYKEIINGKGIGGITAIFSSYPIQEKNVYYEVSSTPIIHVSLFNNNNYIHLFNVLLPSKYKDTVAKQTLRKDMLRFINQKAKFILDFAPNAYIVVMGDFNGEKSDKTITSLKNAYKLNPNIQGSYFYKTWLKNDQILLSNAFFNNDNNLNVVYFNVINDPDLLITDKKSQLNIPFRFRSGNGYSDHLPIAITVKYSSATPRNNTKNNTDKPIESNSNDGSIIGFVIILFIIIPLYKVFKKTKYIPYKKLYKPYKKYDYPAYNPSTTIEEAPPLHPPKNALWISYNVGNLFDDQSDGTEYKDVKKEWNSGLYYKKIINLAKVFDLNISKNGYIELVCLQEIESEKALNDLKNASSNLSKLKYTKFYKGYKDALGIAVLSIYPIEFSYSKYFGKFNRPVVFTKLKITKYLSLDLYTVHLPSKNNDSYQKENVRQEILYFINSKIKKTLITHNPKAYIMVMGDFNYENAEETITDLQNAYSLNKNSKGSYFYSKWQKIDQVLFSSNFRDKDSSLQITSFNIENNNYLLRQDKVSGENIPRNFYKGYGYSDHLPIYVKIN